MKEIKLDVNFKVYPSIDDLEKSMMELMLKAVEVRKVAYAPYSKFRVGAAILLESGEIVEGRKSPNSLYNEKLATYSKEDQFNHNSAVGFIELWGLPTIVASEVNKKTKVHQ